MSEFEVHAKVYGEVLHVLSRLGIAVGETPDACLLYTSFSVDIITDLETSFAARYIPLRKKKNLPVITRIITKKQMRSFHNSKSSVSSHRMSL